MTELNDNSQTSKPEQTNLPPGAQLAAQRQKRGWTIEQVASQLNLAPRQIQALEDDHYAALPGAVIIRGFIRAYAKLLKIEAEPLIAALNSATQPPSAESLELDRALAPAFSESSLPGRAAISRSSARSALLIVLLFIIVGGGWLIYHFGDANLVRDWSVLLSRAPSEQRESAGNASQATPAVSEDPAVPIAAEPDRAAQAETQSLDASVTPAAAIAPEHALVLQFNQESWIEIRRVTDQSPAVARLIQAGKTEVFEVRQPSILVVGNASGVEARFRGEPLNLKANAKTNVARVELN